MPICVGGDAGDADVRGREYVRVSGFQLGNDVAVLFEVHRLIEDGPPPWAV